jgi:hypothetical protein
VDGPRPSVIFGPEDQFVNVLARLIRLTPKVFPLPGGGKARFQPIAVGRCRACRAPLAREEGNAPPVVRPGRGGSADSEGNDRAHPHGDGYHRNAVSVPVRLLRPIVALAQRFMPNPPVTSSLLDLLALDNTVSNNALTEFFKVVPIPFAADELQYLRRITAKSALKSLFNRA